MGIADGYRKVNSTSSASLMENLLGLRRTLNPSNSDFQFDAWSYQQCTEQGFFVTGDEPADTLPVISRFITLHSQKQICRRQFHLNISALPNTASLHKYGGYNLSYPRLMIVGGEADPVSCC